eukprot:gnl/Ergobibamus_cyprinoides/318.p1 GENE.gnl/Ergobibamus_cyprinoides/318~~gnl/Ergobibamus_cyprinoides/318.p1  ORF type:complete len:293 (+),score=71.46 gnl/Ergobibamus_cyprinoides/318:119-880(+)
MSASSPTADEAELAISPTVPPTGLVRLLCLLGARAPPARLERELRRKRFHLAALLIPFCYYAVLRLGLLSQRECCYVFLAIGVIVLTGDVLRLLVPFVNAIAHRYLRRIMRPAEAQTLSGLPFVFFGTALSVRFFPPVITVAALLALIFGDLSAAMCGLSFGTLKLVGSKTLEGCMGMFMVSTVSAYALFAAAGVGCDPLTRLSVSSFGALAATVAELLATSGIFDDNLLIPVAASSAFALAFKLKACYPASL